MFHLKVLKPKNFDNDEKSPFQRFDLIVKINNAWFKNFSEFQAILNGSEPKISVTVIRKGLVCHFDIPTNNGLGASLVEVDSRDSISEIVESSKKLTFEESVYESAVKEAVEIDRTINKRIFQAVLFYLFVAIPGTFLLSWLFEGSHGRTRGVGAMLILLYIAPILYVVLGKRIFR